MLVVLLIRRVVSMVRETGGRGMRHRDADRGPSQPDLDLDLGHGWLGLLLWGK